MPEKPKKPVATWRLNLGKVPPWLFGLFVVGGLIQVFLAGYGIENLGDQGMDLHRAFAHVIEFVPLLILLCGFIGADWRAGVGGVVLLVQFQAQYAFLEGTYAPVLALHALNGVLMIVVATAFFARRLPWSKKSAPAPAARPPTPPQR